MSEFNHFGDPLSDNILQERDETGAVTTPEAGLQAVIANSRSQFVAKRANGAKQRQMMADSARRPKSATVYDFGRS